MQIWETGDFARIATASIGLGESLAEAAPVYAGEEVLDIGCGSGNAALAAARRRARVTGVDPVGALLEEARKRALGERLEVDWRQGGAEALPVEDASFDLALSSFGMIFCPEPARAVEEVARVLRPAGRLVFTAWRAGSLHDRLFAACLERRPDLAGVAVARQWGREEQAIAWLRERFDGIRFERRIFWMRAMDAEQWLAGMRKFLAPVMLAYEGLGEEEAGRFSTEILGLLAGFAPAPNGTVYAPAEYLEIHCCKRRSAVQS